MIRKIIIVALLSTVAVTMYAQKDFDKYMYGLEYHMSALVGIWMPIGNMSLLGNHANFGYQLGLRVEKMTYNITMAFKNFKTDDDFFIIDNGQINTTNKFFGGYIGIDIDREIYSCRRSQFDLLAGIGYDELTSHSRKKDNNNNNVKSPSINSLNINIGIGYKYFINKYWYVALQGKYNFVNYKNNGGSDFSGDVITITILTGTFF